MGIWDKFGGDIIGAGGNILSSFMGGSSSAKAARKQYEYNLALQKQAQQWQEYFYKNRIGWNVEALEANGINKLYGLGNAPMGAAGTNSVGMPDMVNEKNNRIRAILDGISVASQVSAQVVANRKAEQETKTEVFNTELKQLETINKNLDNLYKKKELSYYDKRLQQELQEQKTRIFNNMAQTNESYARAGNVKQLTEESKERTKGISNENVVSGAVANWYKEHPVMAGLAIGLQQFDTGNVNTVLNKIPDFIKLNKYMKNEKNGKNGNQSARGAYKRKR